MVSVNWGAMGIGAVVAFLIGWFLFGLLGAVILAIIAMVVLGIMKFLSTIGLPQVRLSPAGGTLLRPASFQHQQD